MRLQITAPGTLLPVLIDREITAEQADQIITLVGGQPVGPLRFEGGPARIQIADADGRLPEGGAHGLAEIGQEDTEENQ